MCPGLHPLLFHWKVSRGALQPSEGTSLHKEIAVSASSRDKIWNTDNQEV